MRIRTPAQALALVRDRGVLPLAPRQGFFSLVEAVVGPGVRGSWWGHPQGRRIYALATALEASPEVLGVKLLGGRACFLHRSLLPALLRLVTDRSFRREARAGLTPQARALLAAVEKAGTLRLDRVPPSAQARQQKKKARAQLEERLLVLGGSEHTQAGRHSPVLRSFRTLWTPELRRAASALPLSRARGALAPYLVPDGSSAAAM